MIAQLRWEDLMPGKGELTKEEMQEAIKAGIKSWMNDQFAAFGKWTLGGLVTIALGALAMFVLKMNGWHR